MSKSPGGPSQVISLPKGGGALKGIGETFSSDLFTGTGHINVPITLPPGRNGIQPQLNLSYSTGGGNSPFGLGWALGVPEISRRTTGGLPRYQDGQDSQNGDQSESSDTFILSGTEGLVPVARPAPGVTRYRPRTESLFARIEHHTGEGKDFWRVCGKDGLVSIYGTERPADAGPEWQDPAVLADSRDPRRIFAWKLSRTEDPFGNRIVYEYLLDRADDGLRAFSQLYLERARYVDYSDEEGNERFLVSVTLEYGDRPDPSSFYRAGFEIRTRLRCERLVIRTHAGEDRLVRSYRFNYESAGYNRASLLTGLELIGADEVERFPPVRFGYTRFEPEERRFVPLKGRELPELSLAGENIELADLFGRGLPDIVQMNGAIRYWRNLGGGRFDIPRVMREAPAGVDLADPGIRLVDADGNGRVDLAVLTGPLPGYFPLTLDGEWDRRSFQPQRVAPSFSLSDPEVHLVDLDGDGVTDAIRSGARFELFFSDPKEGWSEAIQLERRDADDFPNVSFADPQVRWSDMSGDGLQDVVVIYDGSVEYWPSLGFGRFAPRVLMRNSPRLPFGYDPRRLLLGDIDGDGLTDIVYVDHQQVLVWINQGGEAWSDPVTIDGTPPVNDLAAVRLADVMGTGIAGILWSYDANGLMRERMFYLDIAGSAKPYLLAEMANNTGAVTRIEYAPSTRFYLADQARPETRWKTPLPFPVQVVARSETIDLLSRTKLVTTYRYHHGCWDGGEGEFRGFGMVEQLDTQTFEQFNSPGLHISSNAFSPVEGIHFSPPTLTKTWFHVGPVGEEHGDWEELDWSAEYWPVDPPILDHVSGVNAFLRSLPDRQSRRDALRTLRGAVLRLENYALDGSELEDRPYTVSEQAYGIREEEPPAAESSRARIFFSHTLAQRVTQWERGDDPMTQFEFKQDYDPVGQPLDQIAIACPRGWRRPEDRIPEATPFLATYVRTDYAESDGEDFYCKDRVARTTSHRLKQVGEATVFELKAAITDSSALELIGQSLTYYDGEAFVGLPFGRIGRFGAPVRLEQLVLTEAILREAYRPGGEVATDGSGDIPPYLIPGATVAWTLEYPESFRQEMPMLAAYVFHDGSGPEARGYFAPSKRTRFDFQEGPNGRGLPTMIADDAGGGTKIEFDEFSLLPEKVTDVLGMITRTRYDYRVLQPMESIDPNGNRIGYTYSGLGMLTSIAIMGKEGEETGDTPETPSLRFEYDFLAFVNSAPDGRQPISVRTIQRENHFQGRDDLPPESRDAVRLRAEYSDGFGRLIQRRIQAEDVRFGDDAFGTDIIPTDQEITPGSSVGRLRAANDPENVVVTGVQVYDNKGQVVQQFEPFYSTGFAYAPPSETERGRASQIFYDPRGHVIRTVHSNGSVKRVIFGIPRSLETPEDFIPTPWEVYTYDPNDNAATFEGEHHVDPSHFHTPGSVEVDALGRAIKSATHDLANDPIVIRTEYDIRGNVRRITDSLGRTAFSYVYDLSSASSGSRVLREESLDRGLRRIVFDSSGREIERRDPRGALILQAYDSANRPLRLWARDGESLAMTLRQVLVYGDDAGLEHPEDDNLLGRLFRHFDESGMLELSSYDFKANLLRQVRRVIRDEPLIAVMGAAEPARFQVDWETADAESILEERLFQTDMVYDAVNRLTRVLYPVDAEGDRKTLVPGYGQSGALEQLSLLSNDATEEQTFVHHIAYNAKGQRSLIAYGNGWMTRYAYEPDTFHLSRVRTERFLREEPFTFVPAGGLLQDIGHNYDLNANLVRIRDRAPGCGIPNTSDGPDTLERVFGYDALNRLIGATGREHATRAPSAAPWLDALTPTNQDSTQTRPYREEYDYDIAGNLLEVRHRTSDASQNFTRRFRTELETNRLDSFTQGDSTFGCEYDGAGNLIRHTLSQLFTWNHSDRLQSFRVQAGDGQPSLEAVYLYDALGQRVKKVVRRAGGRIETATYVGSSFEHHFARGGSSGAGALEHNLLHLIDDQRRIAIVRIGEPFADDTFPAVRYELADHLGSSVITMDGSGSELRREEYYPYGDSSFGSFARKRYRFTGRERDEESGLGYHLHRYYAPWLMRWVSPDPVGRADGLNLYRYARNQPMGFVDPEGTSAWSWTKDKFSSIWNYTKTHALSGDFTVGGTTFETTLGRNPYDWTTRANDLIWNHTRRGWGKIKQIAGNLWGWSKSHKAVAIGLGIGAATLLGTLGYFKGKWIMNWVVAPAIRVGTNAAFGYALWGNIGLGLGVATGLVHGLQMAHAGTLKNPQGWLGFIFDNTWSLYNSFLGSGFASLNLLGGNEVNKQSSADMGGLYFKEPWFGDSSTTIGNVTIGQQVPRHEAVHAWQARLLGPAYVPLVLTGYVAALIPIWLIWKDCDFNSGWDYFSKGVYPNTWHEIIAYGVQGDRCSCC